MPRLDPTLKPVIDVERMLLDMALKGWGRPELAQASGMKLVRIHRFLTGAAQTPKTLAALAEALGYTPRRYIKRRQSVAA